MVGESYQVPPRVDVSVPSVARCYDYALGGKDNFEVDRAAVAATEELVPEAGVLAKVNRSWHIRATRFLSERAGIKQYLDLGAGLPTAENTHEVVHRMDREARVVYVDNDPSAAAHGRVLLDDDASVRYIEGDLTKPEEIFGDPVVRDHLDLSQPIALYQSATLHHQPDDLDLVGIMRDYVAALAPGSYVALSHFWDPGGEAGAMVRRIREVMLEQGLDGEHFRSREQISEMLPGLELVPSGPATAEGLVPLLEWWPDGPTVVEPGVVQRCIMGAIGRKP
ncbi:MAG: SAM-dependent methyltransferase [Saccharopolyspora sp.]|uniref:SAM-dependent methyltransferase n=1 Tax=Saccharopolyspora TaxID=1835 RepID=UPI0019091703|nr:MULTISPECIES: SAM-dependent methyltransferase [unclassified Saccharopolyspora]MBK0868386.1 SAM-dependent methyltransferase [Saccharopolyspora sp. HNM0986]MBQ6642687.1 SAM-dependent methyltransferase [Saccharopolyspora sp.]